MEESDFFPIGDEGVVIVDGGGGWGDGAYGDMPWGGGETVIISNETPWTNITEP